MQPSTFTLDLLHLKSWYNVVLSGVGKRVVISGGPNKVLSLCQIA